MRPRDPNAFYWKPQKPVAPANSFSLECQQWRHAADPESFSAEIYSDATAGMLTGIIQCRIQAENLSEPVIKGVPVAIRIKKVPTFAIAQELVRARIARPAARAPRRWLAASWAPWRSIRLSLS